MTDAKSLEDYALEGTTIQEVTQLSRKLAKTKTERDVFKAQIKELEDTLEEAELRSKIFTHLNSHDYKPPTWLTRKSKKSSGVVCTILSDTHFDEVVRPEEIQFKNVAYPIIFLPFISRASEIIGKRIFLTIDEKKFILNFNQTILANSINKLIIANSNDLIINFLDNNNTFSEENWNDLYELSKKTFVDETDSLKSSTAGAGLTDND